MFAALRRLSEHLEKQRRMNWLDPREYVDLSAGLDAAMRTLETFEETHRLDLAANHAVAAERDRLLRVANAALDLAESWEYHDESPVSQEEALWEALEAAGLARIRAARATDNPVFRA